MVQPRGAGRWGAAEQGVQGVPPMGAPLEQLWPLTPAWAPEALLCPLAQSPVPSLAPSSAPVAVQAEESPLVSQSCPGNAGVTSLPRDFPDSAGGFPALTGAEQEGAAGWEGQIPQWLRA